MQMTCRQRGADADGQAEEEAKWPEFRHLGEMGRKRVDYFADVADVKMTCLFPVWSYLAECFLKK